MSEGKSDAYARRRYTYLGASTLMVGLALESPLGIAAFIVGLLFFLAWVLSGMFENDLRTQRIVRRLLKRYDEARQRPQHATMAPTIFVLMDLTQEYEAIVNKAGIDMTQPHADALAALNGHDRELPERLRVLRAWLRWRPWYRIL